jgi:tetratricopeptide (TPR) repeat protein/TolB-like protein
MLVPVRLRLHALAALAGVALAVHPLAAQCPDGSPPPCRGAVVARTAAPALNPKAWIVAPFTNVTRTTELEWLRDAAVNLMSLDMERWTDLSVVPDKRVSDLLRETLGARAAQPIGLRDGLALARRAGAGMLVMGDFFKSGTGARLVANVFDVRTGARLRTVTHTVSQQDSLLLAFGPLTRGVLALPPPTDAATGDVGTGRVDAYQVYLRGLQERNRMEMDEAEALFRQALTLDSTFALAHAELANALTFGRSFAEPERLLHAIAAERLGARLPPRARALIRASGAYARRDLPGMCAAADPLVAADSTDVEAMYAAMTCRIQDHVLLPAGDSAWRFRGDPNAILRLARRSLRADPGFYPAFDVLAQVLLEEVRIGCPLDRTCPDLTRSFRALLVFDGDSLDARYAIDSLGREKRLERFAVQAGAKRGRLLALRTADEWAASAPTSPWAHQARAEVLFLVGRAEEAWQEVHKAPMPARRAHARGLGVAFEIAASTGRGAEARAWFDSLAKAWTGDPLGPLVLALADLRVGRGERWRRFRDGPTGVVTRLATQTGLPYDVLRRVREAGLRSEAGLAEPGLAAAESAVVFTPAPGCRAACRADLLNVLLEDSGQPAPWMPDSIVNALQPRARAVARRDTALARRVAVENEREGSRTYMINELALFTSAKLYVLIGDSASALRVLRFAIDSMDQRQLLNRRNGNFWIPTRPVQRMVMRGELAAALGYPEEAAKWLDRVIDLWAEAEPEWQVVVSRLRTLRAGLKLPARP